MLVIRKNEIPVQSDLFDAIEANRPYIAFAVKNLAEGEFKGKWLCIYNDAVMSVPYFRPAEFMQIVDHTKPSDWRTVRHGSEDLESFPEWIKEPDFYNYLLEDGWKPEKSKWAQRIVRHKYQQYLTDFAERRFGSVEEFRKRLASTRRNNATILAEERGYETPDSDDLTQKASRELFSLDTLFSLATS